MKLVGRLTSVIQVPLSAKGSTERNHLIYILCTERQGTGFSSYDAWNPDFE